MSATKPLAELAAGDNIMSKDGRPRWLYIVNIGDLCNVEVPGAEFRIALVQETGGPRRGWRHDLHVYGHAHGWEVR